MNALAEFNTNPYDVNAAKITFEEVYDHWSNEHFPTVSHSNVQGYKAAWALCDKIAQMLFVDVKLDHLQLIVDESGKNYSTLRKLKTLFGLMYKYAIIHEIIPKERNMVEYLNIKNAGNPNAYDRKPFTKSEVKRVWDAHESNIYYTVILMLIYSGCRISELLDRKCEYLLCTPDGEHFIYRNYYDSYWSPLVEVLNINHTPHCTRHTCISMLTVAGVDDKIIKKIVGHKGQSVTEVVYTHFEIEELINAINKI